MRRSFLELARELHTAALVANRLKVERDLAQEHFLAKERDLAAANDKRHALREELAAICEGGDL